MHNYWEITLLFTLVFVVCSFPVGASDPPIVPESRIILCLLPLEHADAEELTAVLAPFLSSSGTIAPYPHSNTLIIKDKASIVKQLIKVVKGSEDLGMCQNFQETSDN